jgi:hypothetical protein
MCRSSLFVFMYGLCVVLCCLCLRNVCVVLRCLCLCVTYVLFFVVCVCVSPVCCPSLFVNVCCAVSVIGHLTVDSVS